MDFEWEEYPLAIKEEILSDLSGHDELIESLIDCPMELGGFSIDSFPGFRLIELLHPGRSLNSVYLAITDPSKTPIQKRRTVCIKTSDFRSHSARFSITELTDCSEAIDREAAVLGHLAKTTDLMGIVPKLLHHGSVKIGPISAPYLVTEYMTEVQRARPEDLDSIENINDLLGILAKIHRAGVIHGDLTMENLLVEVPIGNISMKSRDPKKSTIRWRVIDFGSAMYRPKWGLGQEAKRPNFIHRLAGSLDEIRYACRPDASYDVACLAMIIQEATQLQFAKERGIETANVRALWDQLTDPRPEYRPSDAERFRRSLKAIADGEPIKTRAYIARTLRSSFRRNPRSVALGASAAAVLLFAGSYAFYQQELNQQAVRLNTELSTTVDSLLKSNSSMLRQMTDLAAMERIGLSQSRTQINGLISDSLRTLANTKLNQTTRIAALRLLLDIADSVLEVEKAEASSECLNRTIQAVLELKGQAIGKQLEVGLLEIQAKSKQLLIAMNYKRALPTGENHEAFAKSLISKFLSLELEPSDPRIAIRRDGLRCAMNLLLNALYPFRENAWVLSGHPTLVERVYHHAMQGIDENSIELTVPIASLETEFGYLIHKGFLGTQGQPLSIESNSIRFDQIRKLYYAAQTRINGLRLELVPIEDMVMYRDLRSRIPNLLCLSFTQSGNFVEGRDQLQASWTESKKELEEASRSMLWLKRNVQTAWNLADSYLREALQTAPMDDPNHLDLLRASIPYRRDAYILSQRWLQLDNTTESQTALLVNGLRWFLCELTLDNLEEGLRILEQTDGILGLRQPPFGHDVGQLFLLAAAFLHVRSPDNERYREMLDSQIHSVREWLLTQMSLEMEKSSSDTSQKQFALQLDSMMDRKVFNALHQDSAWQSLRELLQRVASR
jgi:serine/threonine protein kinase